MIRIGCTMVLWSYLLLGLPAFGSLDHVLEPLDELPSAAHATDRAEEPADEPETDSDAARPLVEVGADELDLLAELERLLAAEIEPRGELHLTPISTLPRLPQGASLPTVELLEHPPRIAATSILLRFRLRQDDRVLGVYTASFRVQLMADVWMPLHRLSPGDPLSAADVEARTVDLVREPRAVPATASVFNEYELARAVAPGRPLAWSDLAPRPLVRKGSLVEVVAQEGLLAISMKGEATRSGTRGEIIAIRNLESKREFPAEIIDENKVRVQF